MPPAAVAGDLLLALFTNDGSATVTTPANWTLLGTAADSNRIRASVFAKIASGTEGGGTVNFQTSSNEQAAAQVYRITGWGGDVRDVEISAAVAGLGANPNCGPLAPTWGEQETLWLAFVGYSSGAVVNAYPAGFGNGTLTRSATSGTTATAEVASARLEALGASEDPAPFTLSASSSSVAWTVAVRSSAIPRFKTLFLAPAAGTPANSPRWSQSQSSVTLRLAQNTETGIYSAVAHVVGKPCGAAAEDRDYAIATQAALVALVDLVDAAANSRATSVSAAERNEFAALRDAA